MGLVVLGKVGLEAARNLWGALDSADSCLLLHVKKEKEGEAAVVLHQAGTDGGSAVSMG